MEELQALLKVTIILGCSSRFLNCINGTKSRSVSYNCVCDNSFL